MVAVVAQPRQSLTHIRHDAEPDLADLASLDFEALPKPALSAADAHRLFRTEMLPHRAALMARGLHITRSAADAHDLTQDTFLKAWRALHTFEPGTNAKAWLLRIQMNTFINGYRRRAKERDILTGKERLSAEHEMVHLPSKQSTLNPAQAHADNCLSDATKLALHKLSEAFRSVVMLCDIDGLAYQEAADRLGIPVGTVMSRLFRARRQLQECLFALAIESGVLHPTLHGAPGKPMALGDYRRRRARA
jgi:RNA polymerase sigma-70 factor, ECF subfamily